MKLSAPSAFSALRFRSARGTADFFSAISVTKNHMKSEEVTSRFATANNSYWETNSWQAWEAQKSHAVPLRIFFHRKTSLNLTFPNPMNPDRRTTEPTTDQRQRVVNGSVPHNRIFGGGISYRQTGPIILTFQRKRQFRMKFPLSARNASSHLKSAPAKIFIPALPDPKTCEILGFFKNLSGPTALSLPAPTSKSYV